MGDVIRLKGVRQNNLKNFDLDIPVNQLTVITGVSGSGKSSLAFDTLFAEGQRRYIETFSPYARQFFDRMDKPQVDRIEGIPPAIAIEQKNTVKSTRSTVGTMTEICDYMKDLWLHFSEPYCASCGKLVSSESPDSIWKNAVSQAGKNDSLFVVFGIPLSASLGIDECLKSVISQGYQRCLLDGEVQKIDQLVGGGFPADRVSIDVIQDRIRAVPRSRSRFIEACETAFGFGKERLSVFVENEAGSVRLVGQFSRLLECSDCQQTIPSPTRSFFSFNSPVGACPECRGFGRVIGVDYSRAIPDSSASLAGGAVKPWQSGHGMRSQRDMMKIAKRDGISTDIPYRNLSDEEKAWVTYGTPGYGEKGTGRWPKAWYGIKGYFDWLETKAYKMHYRILLARYRDYYECAQCCGSRFKPDVLNFRIRSKNSSAAKIGGSDSLGLNLADFYQMSIDACLVLVTEWEKKLKTSRHNPLNYALEEVCSRLQFLVEVGLGYLTLDRPTKTLSGGETERINLTTCLGTRLVNTLFVLDEPSVGLHAVDVDNLIRILHRLKEAGNTVVVVEHDAAIIRAADFVVDIGPRSGSRGGELIYAGAASLLSESKTSVTASFLNGIETISSPGQASGVGSEAGRACLSLSKASCHNLQDVSVKIPLNKLVCLTGVSGSGKTTLVKEVLVPELKRLLEDGGESESSEHETTQSRGTVLGSEALDSVIMVDQSPIGKTPRSNPAVYIGVFEYVRKLFASSDESQAEGLKPGDFSFNSPAGRCDDCRGAGFEKIEMQFLSDVFIACSECQGGRYRRKIRSFSVNLAQFYSVGSEKLQNPVQMTIVEFLAATVDEGAAILHLCENTMARRALTGLKWLQAVGLGHLRLGQAINTLSGGESQRLKVVKHLCHTPWGAESDGRSLFVFDEPTTGLHFSDVNVLLKMFREMIKNGHSLLVVEHHLDLIRNADWVIDLGPGAGEHGGRIVFEGIPANLANKKKSRTGQMLLAGA